MSDIILRRAERADYPALGKLWRECFGDSDGFIEAFFAALDSIGGGMVAECDGCIAGAAYAICDAQLVLPGDTPLCVGYIYGVGVHDNYRSRGIGRAVTRAAKELALALGAQIISTLPAEDGLYPWYEDVIGVKKLMSRTCTNLSSSPAVSVAPISASDYNARRESICSSLPHLSLSIAAMEFEAAFLREYGGGLFAVGDGAIAAAYVDNDRAVVRELLGAAESLQCDYAAAVGAALYTETVELWRECGFAESGVHANTPGHIDGYIAADRPLPAGLVWGISFD